MKDFTQLTDLASTRLGGEVLLANDEFFAPKENLLKPEKPVWREHEYTDRGKWMDGWETRRRRTPGHDWCILRLGVPGILRGVVVDTSFFRGNYPEHCSIEACALEGTPGADQLTSPETRWVEILPRSPLAGDAQNVFPIADAHRFTHLRLKIYPDGGVARLRVHGEVVPDWKPLLTQRGLIDLAAARAGGRPVASSDAFFSAPLNLLMPGPSAGMHDGWETKRRRGPGYDWVIVKLGIPGEIQYAEVDTAHFKGNFPESCSLEICDSAGPEAHGAPAADAAWKEILPRTKLKADARHVYENELQHAGAATHVRFNIFPDGGVSRLRLFGTPRAWTPGLARLNALPAEQAAAALRDCCGAAAWVKRMCAARPFASVAQLMEAARSTWLDLGREDCLESFRTHPRIGEKKAAASLAAAGWSEQEQSGARGADAATMTALAELNRAYEAKFGHIFIVCATGRSALDIFSILKQRLENDPKDELRMAAKEQLHITLLRLGKLLEP